MSVADFLTALASGLAFSGAVMAAGALAGTGLGWLIVRHRRRKNAQ